MRLAILLALVTMTTPAVAQDLENDDGWEVMHFTTTAQLSSAGWRLVGVVNLPSIGNESRDVLTFWETDSRGILLTARCLTSFDNVLATTAERCERPPEPEVIVLPAE